MFIPLMIVGVIVFALGALTVGSAGAGIAGIGIAVVLGVVFGLPITRIAEHGGEPSLQRAASRFDGRRADFYTQA